MERMDTARRASDQADRNTHQNHLTWNSALALITLSFCQSMAVRIMSLPLNRLIESRYCQEYYGHHNHMMALSNEGIPEEHCKVNTIQKQLAVLQGIIETMHVLCGEKL
jgi:hypothetical protein